MCTPLPVSRAVAPPQLGCLALSASFPSAPQTCLGGHHLPSHQREEAGRLVPRGLMTALSLSGSSPGCPCCEGVGIWD